MLSVVRCKFLVFFNSILKTHAWFAQSCTWTESYDTCATRFSIQSNLSVRERVDCYPEKDPECQGPRGLAGGGKTRKKKKKWKGGLKDCLVFVLGGIFRVHLPCQAYHVMLCYVMSHQATDVSMMKWNGLAWLLLAHLTGQTDA